MIALSQPAKGHLAMLGFSLAIAGSFSFGKLIANDIDPVALTAVRFLAASVLLMAIALSGSGPVLNSFRAPWRFAVAGTLMAVYFVTMFEGLKTAPAVSLSAVLTFVPAMSALFGWMLLRQAATRRVALALAIGGFGAAWVIFRADLAALLSFRIGPGEAVFFAGCAAHALYTPFVRKFHRGEPAVAFACFMTACGTLLLVAYGWRPILETDWLALPFRVWAVLGYITLFATVLTFSLLTFASMRLPSAKVMAYTYLTPTWVLVWEALLGNGLPRFAILFGVIATAAALLILLRQEPEPETA